MIYTRVCVKKKEEITIMKFSFSSPFRGNEKNFTFMKFREKKVEKNREGAEQNRTNTLLSLSLTLVSLLRVLNRTTTIYNIINMSFSSALLNQYQQQYHAISDRRRRHPSSSSLNHPSMKKKKKNEKKELYSSSCMRQRSGASCCSSSMASNSSSSSLCFVSEDEEIDDDDGGNENRYATTRRRTAVLGAAAAAAAAVITMTPFTENAEAAVTSFVPKTATRAKTSLQNVVELTPENFKEYVSADAENPTPNVFVEFYAPWCPFCQKLEPIWNELPNELRKYGNETTIARMNVDKYTDYARAYGVSGFPTLMLFEAGKPVGAKTGLIDMQTALKYAGVSKAKLGFAAGPEKALDKVLTKDQVENARKELDIVRKEVSSGLAGESRDKALTALNVVDGVFVSQL